MSPPENLTQVDKLEFLVLVDNSEPRALKTRKRLILAMTSVPMTRHRMLPPGFTHELPQHLSAPDVPIDPLTKVPLLDLDNFCCGAHGLSILIKTTIGEDTHTVLLDGGPENHTIARNVAAMSIDLTELDAMVLSHWHRDHSGGLLEALRLRQSQARARNLALFDLTVDLHPDRPLRRGISRPPDPRVICCLPQDPLFEEFETVGGEVEKHDEPHEILGRGGRKTGVGVSGEIRRVSGFEKGVLGGMTWMDDGDGDGAEPGWADDPLIRDERFVVVDVKGKGLVVFSSCSHAGICNVLLSLTPLRRPIHSVVGGLHLVPTHIQPAKETVDFLARRIQPTPKYVVPLHCTGFEARAWLRRKMGEGCVAGGTGLKVVFQFEEGDEEDQEVDLRVLP